VHASEKCACIGWTKENNRRIEFFGNFYRKAHAAVSNYAGNLADKTSLSRFLKSSKKFAERLKEILSD
jgi:hypothetical protein